MTLLLDGLLIIIALVARAFFAGSETAITAADGLQIEHLVRHAGSVVSKQDLLDAVWSSDFDGDPNIVEVYIRRLRRQIDEPFDRHSLQTVRGAGYRLVDETVSR
jgi:DNA-binding response OmpR family regulator